MKRPELMIVSGESAGKKFTVKEGGLRLGRSSSNDIHVNDGELSRNHCLFEISGETGIRVIDLASANGTIVNGVELGSEPRELKSGDVVEVGSTVIKVVGGEPPPAAVSGDVDLGLSAARAQDEIKPAQSPRRRAANLLWAIAVLALGSATAVLLLLPRQGAEAPQPTAITEEARHPVEVYYEKVEADTSGIFRYELTFSRDGVLKVVVDDVPDANRHLVKSSHLSDAGVGELSNILDFEDVRRLDREYSGPAQAADGLKSWRLKVVYPDRVRSVSIVNTQEPDVFRSIRERLETFSKNELGIWAIQYSRDKLVEMAEESVRLARQKWEDRDVQHGNMHAAISAFREAMFYLETVNPKPEFHGAVRDELELAERELDRRFRDQRFRADRALNLGEWQSAKRELSVLMEMVPDRGDERYREAKSKLVDVDKRMKKEGGRR